MGLYKALQTDADIEKEGVYISYYDDEGDDLCRVRVARAGGANKAFDKAMNAALKKHKKLLDASSIGSEKNKAVMRQLYADNVITAWETAKRDESNKVVLDEKGNTVWIEGIESPTGELLPFTSENVVKTLKNLPKIYTDVALMSNNDEAYRKDIQEEEAKN